MPWRGRPCGGRPGAAAGSAGGPPAGLGRGQRQPHPGAVDHWRRSRCSTAAELHARRARPDRRTGGPNLRMGAGAGAGPGRILPRRQRGRARPMLPPEAGRGCQLRSSLGAARGVARAPCSATPWVAPPGPWPPLGTGRRGEAWRSAPATHTSARCSAVTALGGEPCAPPARLAPGVLCPPIWGMAASGRRSSGPGGRALCRC